MKSTYLFLKKLIYAELVLLPLFISQCAPKSSIPVTELKLSLAQWSIHRALEAGTLLPENFAAIAKNDFGISAVEYVNSFYKAHATDEAFWKKMRNTADSLGVKSLLIMVDEEGDLGNPNAEERKASCRKSF